MHTLKYTKPAEHWNEALPLGNGRLGAMVYGGVEQARFALNLDTLWAGGPADRNNPRALKALPRVQELLFAGHNEEATDLAGQDMLGTPPTNDPYEPLGDLLLEMQAGSAAEDYIRELDMDAAIAHTRYRSAGATYTRRSYVSAPDQVLVVQVETQAQEGLKFTIAITREENARVRSCGSRILLDGATDDGLSFYASARVLTKGGSITQAAETLQVEGASSVTILLAAATGIEAENPERMVEQQLDAASARSLAELEDAHVHEHRSWYRRMDFKLAAESEEVVALSIPERIKRVGEAGLKVDPGLLVTAFHHRRYLQIAASRPGSIPSNLQGIWNYQFNPPWNSDFHPNINLQMNYWPAETVNLPETVEPLIDWLEAIVAPGQRTAEVHYGCRGWVLHHVSDQWGTTCPCAGAFGIWPVGGAWMVQHVWWHYEYSRDLDFLRQRGWPLIQGAARFILDFLVEAPAGTPVAGKLVTCPSHSPENTFIGADGQPSMLTYAATMDTAIVRELLEICIRCCERLECDAEFADEARVALARLPEYQISERTGGIQEWIEDYEEAEPGHRHMSHLFGLYPGTSISPQTTPDLAQACAKSMRRRMEYCTNQNQDTAWALGWRACLWARLGEGNEALVDLERALGHRSTPNLMVQSNGRPQVADAHGLSAAVCELLLQDYDGLIRLLPALPGDWAEGAVTGLRSRGGLSVSIRWSQGQIVEASLSSAHSQSIQIQTPQALDWSQSPTSADGDCLTFDMVEGERLTASAIKL